MTREQLTERGYRTHGNAALLADGKKRGTMELVRKPTDRTLREAEEYAEGLVLDGGILVSTDCGPFYQRMAIVPLRWGAPRILVFNGTLEDHLGTDLTEEPFRAARLWRYKWDGRTDLAIAIGGNYSPNFPSNELRDVIGEVAGCVTQADPEWQLMTA